MAKKKKRTKVETAKQTDFPVENQSSVAPVADDTLQTDSADESKSAQNNAATNNSSGVKLWLPWLILSLTVAGIYFNQLTGYSLIDPGETINSESARQMLQLKNYFVPFCNYQVDSHSFVLPTWLVALSYQLSSPGATAARLPFAILASLLVLATYLTTRRLVDKDAALLAALMTAAAPLLLVGTRTDTTALTFATALDLALYATALTIFARVKHIYFVLWSGLALAVLCRGPVALFLYFFALALFFAATKVKAAQLKHWLLRMAPVQGLIILMAITLPVFYCAGKAYIRGLAHYPNYTGFYLATPAKSDWLFYLPVLAYGLAPWFLLLPQALKNHFFVPLNESWFGGRLNFKSSYRPYDKDRVRPVQPDDAELSAIDIERLSLFLFTTFALAYLLIFSFAKLQSDTFILPVIAPLAISLAVIANRLARPWQAQGEETSDPLRWDRFWLQCIFGIICALTIGVCGFIVWAATLPGAGPRPDWILLLSTLPLAVATIMQILAIQSKNWSKALWTATVTMALIVTLAHPTLLRYYTSKTEDDFVSLTLQLKDAPYDIALLGPFRPSINTYLNRPVATISDTSALRAVSHPGAKPHRLLLVTDKSLSELKSRSSLDFVPVVKQGPWTCYGLTDVEIKP